MRKSLLIIFSNTNI